MMMAEDTSLADSSLIAITEIQLLLPDQVPLIRTAEFFCAAPHQLRQLYLAQVHPATSCHPVTLLSTANIYFDDFHQLQAAICGLIPSYEGRQPTYIKSQQRSGEFVKEQKRNEPIGLKTKRKNRAHLVWTAVFTFNWDNRYSWPYSVISGFVL